MGIDTIARRYGVKLVDLNQGPFRQVDLDGLKVQIAEAAFENDFLINVPVLRAGFGEGAFAGERHAAGGG